MKASKVVVLSPDSSEVRNRISVPVESYDGQADEVYHVSLGAGPN
jgi:hypothetical protein